MRSLAALLCLAHGAAAFNKPQAAGLCDPGVKQYSGYIDLSTGAKHLFYWAFESRNDPATDPVILWMTGGPGCSSEVALFGENGPCSVTPSGNDTLTNPYSWNSKASVIYIDQPAGTGFSYGTGLVRHGLPTRAPWLARPLRHLPCLCRPLRGARSNPTLAAAAKT